MIHALTYSLIQYLKTKAPELTEVVWMYDNITLTGKTKPFATVEQLDEDSETLAAGREDFEEIYRFQIGLHTRSVGERSKMSDKAKVALRQSDIPFLDTTGPAPVSAGFFVCDVTGVTPIPIKDVEDETNTHRVYLDVAVTVYRQNNDVINFTQ